MKLYNLDSGGVVPCQLMYFNGEEGIEYTCPRTGKACVGHLDVFEIGKKIKVIGLNTKAMARCPSKIGGVEEALKILSSLEPNSNEVKITI